MRQACVSALRQEDAFREPDRDREDASDDQQRYRSEDRMNDSATFADGFPRAEKEVKVDHFPSVGDQRVQQARQRDQAQDDAQPHQGEHRSADPSSAGGAGHAGPPATCLRTISRAITFTASVTRNSSSAISISDAVNRSLGASANWLAMVLA